MPDGLLGRFVLRRGQKGGPAAIPVPAAAHHRPEAREGGDVLLRIDGLSKSFKGLQALDGVSFDVRRGEILGLVGPNGSGKSTLINAVTGHYTADAGRILFEGADIAQRQGHVIASAGIARTYQIPRPFAHLTVLQNVMIPARFGRARLDHAAAEREAWRWLEFTGLTARAHVLPDDLNLHQRKFLELARALASRPSLLLLDEVLSGLTPSEIDEAIRTIRTIRDTGATIVFVEHVMRAVMELTDRIVVLNHGKVIAEGVTAEVMRRNEVITAYLGKPHA
jgi:branched-chain amino acid transport system permease protein